MLNIFRSQYDPKASDEGGIDPLGFAAMGEYLGQLYLPGMIERLRRPRFLSLVAVGLYLKSEVETGLKDSEYETDFWEAFEWNVVTGLIAAEKDDIRNLPSTLKAKQARKLGERLNAERYLKAPSVFGFHGVYKFLAKNLDIEFHDQAGEAALTLANAWAKDRKLPGFMGAIDSPGYREKIDLVHHLKETIKSKRVSRDWRKEHWSFIFENFDHTKPGINEKRVIMDLLLKDSKRKEVIDFLQSSKGQRFLESDEVNERKFLEAVSKVASPELLETLKAILAFERFARALNDTFYDIIAILTSQKHGLSVEEIALEMKRHYPTFNNDIYQFYQDAIDKISAHSDRSLQLRMNVFQRFSAKISPSQAVREVISHHEYIQKNKSTGKKNPWLLNNNGHWLVRAGYTHRLPGTHDERLVNAYRLSVLKLFLKDLKV